MLIKIVRSNDHPRNFTLFDNAEAVECFCPTQFNGDFNGDTELKKWLEQREPGYPKRHFFLDGLPHKGAATPETPEQPWILLYMNQSYSVSRILFQRAGEEHEILFDGTAYVCTDDGKTLERIEAGGRYETSPPDLAPAPSAA